MYAEKTGTQWETIKVKALIRTDEATSGNGVDVTSAIINPGIYNANAVSVLPYGWYSYGERKSGNGNYTAAGNANTLLELWSNNAMQQDIYQEILNVPNGVYKVTANCHDRKGTNGYYVYGYDQGTGFRSTGLVNVSGDDNYADITTGWLLVTNGKMNVGFKGESAAVTDSWVTADNFRLTYYGEPSADNAFDFTSVIPALTGASGNYSSYKEKYETTTETLGNLMYSTVSDIPNGIYEAVFYAAASYTNGRGFSTSAADNDNYMTYVFGNESQTSIPVVYRTAVATVPEVTVSNIPVFGNTLTMGMQKEGKGSNWHVLGVKSLKLIGTDYLSAYSSALTAAQTKATNLKTLIEGKTEASPTDILTTAAATTAASASVSDYQTAITTINNYTQNAWTLYAYAHDNGDYYGSMKNSIEALKSVVVSESTSEKVSTLDAAVAEIDKDFMAATTTADMDTQIVNLRTAIYTYIDGLTPTGDPFDLTCIIVNPSFTNNTTQGWTYTKTGGSNQASYTCNEFFNNTFDFYQTLSGLPAGSYQLSVQAFSRPGANGDTTAGAYYDFYNGVNNVTAELYINTQSKKVGNIYSYKDNTTGAKVASGDLADFHCTGLGDDDYWVPNGMQGSSLYFDDDAYITQVACLVGDDGNLQIGFRDNTLTANQWTIFDNFQLKYYGSDKTIYYKQYLPQLEAEIAANYLNNGAYSALKSGQTERAELETANAADADKLDTESDFEETIAAIEEARVAFMEAKTVYDNLQTAYTNAATDYPFYEGDGIFEMKTSQKTTFDVAVSTATSTYTTGTASKATAQAAIDAIAAAYVLNAPNAEKHYKLTLDNKGTLTFETPGSEGYSMPFKDAADYMAQTFILTPVDDETNTYTLSFEGLDGNTHYICTRAQYGSGGTGTAGIRTFADGDDAKEALKIKVQGTTTKGVFNMLNTEDSNNKLGAENDGSFYTSNANTDWSIAEASQASVTVSAKAGKFGTVILPFTPDVSEGFDGITFYAFNEIADGKLNITSVDAPQANTPYLVKNTTGSDFSKALLGYGTASQSAYNSESLYGVYTTATIPASDEDNVRYVLQTQSGTQAFYKVTSDFTATAYKCYLQVPVEKAESVKAFFFDDDLETAISSLEDGTAENATIYNLAGQRVSRATKGIYVIGGKKKVIK